MSSAMTLHHATQHTESCSDGLEARLGKSLFRPPDTREMQIPESGADMVLDALSADRVHFTVPDRPGAQDLSSPSHP